MRYTHSAALPAGTVHESASTLKRVTWTIILLVQHNLVLTPDYFPDLPSKEKRVREILTPLQEFMCRGVKCLNYEQ